MEPFPPGLKDVKKFLLVVTPVKTGVQEVGKRLNPALSGFRLPPE